MIGNTAGKVSNDWKLLFLAVWLAGAAVASAQDVLPDNGPLAGGNVVTVTNGSFGTVTNVVVGDLIDRVDIMDSGVNWVSLVMPPATNAGPVDITIQTADSGETTLTNAYTYNPAGEISSSSGDWVNLGEGVNGVVRALATDGTNLYVGGYFTMAGGQTANRIAYWDGTSWHSMGDGMNSVVHALLYTGGKLYVGGSFSSADGLLANKIAVWDGTTWGTFGNGFNDTVLALAHDGTTLYASGYFTYAASTAIDRIARWNGSSWSGIGGGLSEYGSALAFGNGNLFVGGDFTTKPAGCHSIAMWNGSSWNSMNGGVSNIVQALVHDGENLYAGGNFSRVASRVGMWDGTSWTSPGGGVSGGNVNSLLKVGDDLYVGGGFTEAGGAAVNRIARWNGTSWTNVGSGMNNAVSALAFNDGILYAGGSFTNAGGKAASRVAQFVLNQPTGIDPASGAMAGGYPVTILGTNLGNGADITNVTLCGVSATIVSQSSTQVVVTAGASSLAGLGDVRIFSTSFGETMQSDAFTYEGRGLRVLGTNDVPITSGDAPSEAKGTDLPLTRVGTTPTLDLRIENTGTALLTIDRADVTGSDRFTVEGLPATVAAGGISNFTVRFNPDAAGAYTGAVALVSDADGAVSNYVVNLSGTAYGITTNIGPFAGGNTITITIGGVGTITNVVVGDLTDPVDIVDSGVNWVTVVMPAATNAGTVDITLQTSGNGDFVIPAAYTYNPPPQIGWSLVDSNAWAEVQPLPRPVHGSASVSWNGALYVMGGNDSVANVNLSNVYRMGSCGAWEEVAGLPAARQLGAAAVYKDAIYYIGGYDGSSRTNVYRFDGTNWVQVAGLPYPRHTGSATVLGDDLYHIGGRNGSTFISAVYRFDGTNWTPVASLPAERARLASVTHDGKIYAIGGLSGSAAVTNVYVFDGTNWTQTAGLPLATEGHAAVVFDDRIFTVGGFSHTQSFVYDGASWTTAPGLPAIREYVSAATHDNAIYACGGRLSSSQYTVYRYPALDENTGVFPPAGTYTGGYQVVISGSNLCDGSPGDIESVTLCGVPVASIDAVSATQIVVTAAEGKVGRGDVVVRSTSFGTATASNAFYYAYWTELDFDFGAADWESTNISMVGSAYWPNSTGWNTKRLRLTSSTQWQRGNGWVKSHRINPSRDWVAAWRCSFSWPNPADNPADGASFNIHTNGVDYHPTMNEQLGKNEAAVLTVNVHMNTGNWRGLRVFANGLYLGGARMNGLKIDRNGEYPIAVTARYDAAHCALHVSLHQPATGLGTSMVFKVNLAQAIGETAIGTFGFSGRTGDRTENNDILDFNIKADMGSPEMAVVDAAGSLLTNGAPFLGSGAADFRHVPLGAVTSRVFAITNSGLMPLVIASNALTGSSAFAVTGLPAVVESGSASNFTVTFSATNYGNHAATLTLTPAVLPPYVLNFGATVYSISTNVGPSEGGRLVTLTNYLRAGESGIITNMLVGGQVAEIFESGANWISFITPSNTAGAADIVLQTDTGGVITVQAAYEYLPAGRIFNRVVGDPAWQALGTGMDNYVYDLIIYQGNLVAAGVFTSAGGVPGTSYIAMWGGTNWLSMGGGCAETVTSLATDGTNLYAGGYFTSIGALTNAHSIARWDGTSWTNMSKGFNLQVHSLLYAGNTLYAGGRFTHSSDNAVQYNGVARWSGSSWLALGSGIDHTTEFYPAVFSMEHDGTNLYVGGMFNRAGGNAATNIARWNGSSWSKLGNGVPRGDYYLAGVGSLLYKDGFLYAGGDIKDHLQRWNGLTWDNALGALLNDDATDIISDGANVMVGGKFTSVNGQAIQYIAEVDTTTGTWTTNSYPGLISMGYGSAVGPLTRDENWLYAGGKFTSSSDTNVKYIARWGEAIVDGPGVEPASGSWTGGYEVVITGSNLGNGSDVTNVTLNGRSVTQIVSQSSTQIVVVAAAASSEHLGLGDVRVYSESYGITLDTDAFTYTGAGLLVSGPGFPPVLPGGSVTRTYTVTNTGTETLTITAVTNAGPGAALFDASSMPTSVAPATASSFPVVFTGGGTIGDFPVTFHIANNSPAPDATFGLTGRVYQVSTNAGPQSGGNIITITNGNFGTVTNVLVGATQVSPLQAGYNWVTVVMPARDGHGPVDITIQTADGDIVIPSAYTYNRLGRIFGYGEPVPSVWTNLGSGLGYHAYAIAHDEEHLYAGGLFSDASGVLARNVAQWSFEDGYWTNMGAGLQYEEGGVVYDLLHDGFRLYAAGQIGGTLGSSTGLHNVAVWDGANWTPLGSGLDNTAYALAHDGTNLYAGGIFSTAGGNPANRVARWDGTSWSALAEGVAPGNPSHTVKALLHDGVNLYAGGNFTNAGAIAANSIAMWNGASWTNLGTGTRGFIEALATDGVNLYIGGGFTNIGGVAATNVAKWDGTSWSALGGGIGGQPNDFVADLVYDGSNLYAIGQFLLAEGQTVNRVAMWDGTSWTNLGSGLGWGSFALDHNGFNLYAGGMFTEAGGVAAHYIAQWGPVRPFTTGVTPTNGATVGGYEVTISGRRLGNGSDITNVTLCGVNAQSIVSQSPTQLVVVAGASSSGSVTGDVRVFSTSFGETVRSNAFAYYGPGLPVVTNPTATNITSTTATLGGLIASTNGAPVTGRGIVWSLTDGFDPATNGTRVGETGSYGTGVFTVAVSGLAAGATNYFVAYAVNAVGTNYSGQGCFTTVVESVGGALAVSPSSLSFSGTYGGSDPAGQPFVITNFGERVCTFQNSGVANWFSVAPASASLTNNASTTVTGLVSLASLNAGTHVTTNRVTGGTNGTQTLVVTVTVAKATATLSFSNTNQVYDGTAKTVSVVCVPSVPYLVSYNGSTTAPTTPGVYAVTGTVEDANYTGSGTTTFTITKAPQAITFGNPGAQSVTTTLGLAATASSGLPVSFAVVDGPATLTGLTNLTFSSAGWVSIAASQTGSDYYLAAPVVTQRFEVTKAQQAALVFTPTSPQNYGTTNGLSVSGGSGSGAVAFSVVSGPGLLVGSTNLALLSGTGTVTIAATKYGDDSYLDAAVTGTVAALPKQQTIEFPIIGNLSATNRLTLSATASSGLAVDFAVLSGPAVLTDLANLHFTNAGSVQITATQNGDANWAPASATNTFDVTKAPVIVTLQSLTHTYDGTPKAATYQTDPADLSDPAAEVLLTYDGSTDAPSEVGDYAVTGTVVSALYAGTATGTLSILDKPRMLVMSSTNALPTNASPSAAWGTDLGTVATNESVTVTLSITNAGGLMLEITGVGISGGDLTVSNLPAVVEAGGISNFTAHVAPSSLGAQPLQIAITNNSIHSPYLVNLAVSGVRPGEIGLNAAQISFQGTYSGGNPAAQSFMITNKGGVAFAWSNAWATSAPDWITLAPATGLLEAGATAWVTGQVTVGYLDAGTYRATNTINSPTALNSPVDLVLELTVGQATQTITFANPGAQLTTGTLGLAATASSGLPVSFTVVSGPADLADQTNLTYRSDGWVAIAASQSGNANYLAAPAITQRFEVTKAPQAALVFSPASPQQYLTTNGLSTSGGSGTGAVSFAVLSGPGSLSGDTQLVAEAGTGEIVVRAFKASDALYQSASALATVTLSRAAQSIDFTNPGPQTATNTTPLSASASSGLPVAFSVVSGPAQFSGASSLTYSGMGTVSVEAAQSGNLNWLPAPSVTQAFVVGKAIAAVELSDLAHTYDGQPKSATATTVPPELTVDITYDASADQPVNAGAYAVVATVNDPSYQGTATGTLVIAKAAQTLVFTPASPQTYNTTNALAATGEGSGTVTFAVLSGPGQIIVATNLLVTSGSGIVQVTATIAEDANYLASATTATVVCAKANQTITFEPINDQFWTNVLTLSATASSGLDVAFEVMSGPASVTNLTGLVFDGYGEVVVAARQIGDDNYNAAPGVTNTFDALGPIMVMLGTNGTAIESGADIQSASGTDFGEAIIGLQVFTNVFTITNSGNATLTISSVSTGGSHPASFEISNMISEISPGTSSMFQVIFDPQTGASNTASFTFTFDGTNSPFTLNVGGFGLGGGIALETNELFYIGTMGGANPPVQTLVMSNVGLSAFNWTNSITYSPGATNWLTILPNSGTVALNGHVSLDNTVNIAGLDYGMHTARVVIASQDATNAPREYVATLMLGRFTNVASGITIQQIDSRTNRLEGLVYVDFAFCNTSSNPLYAPFYFSAPSNQLYYLARPDGTIAGTPYVDVTTQFHRELAGSIMRPGDCATVTNIPFYFRFLQPQQVDGKLWANQQWSWQPPVAADQTIRIRYGTTNYLGEVGLVGEARPPLDYEVVNIPIKGDLDWNADGSFGYRPDPDYVGRDDFLFRVTNPDGVSTGRVDMVIWRGNAVPVWYLLLQ